MPRALGVIPARYASTRFPGKPLASLGVSSVIEHVWRGANGASRLARVVVATEDERIVAACRAFGAETLSTSPDHPSGTDRVAEALEALGGEFDIVVNVQGDEPFVTGTSLNRLVLALERDPGAEIATLSEPLLSEDEIADPNAVKVVAAENGRALYFSRAPIPYHRATETALSLYRKHQGIYAYRAAALRALTRTPPSPLERCEGLEQLRALEAGMRILVVDSDFRSIAVDTPADLERAARALASSSR